MKLLLPIVLASTALAVMPARFDGCRYTTLRDGAYNNCDGNPCSAFNCFQACGRAGSKDNRNTFVMVGDYNGPILNSCSCKCNLR